MSKKYLNLLFLFLFIIIILIFLFNYIIKANQIKVCLCVLAKLENNYIREYIEHYKKYGIDTIFLYDNNDINDERFDEIINDYIESGLVKLINYRGKKAMQQIAYDNCYKDNNKLYNWFLFYDIDEFINLNQINIKYYLNRKKFNKCNIIQLNWVMHTDNNLLHYSNEYVAKRFPKIGKSLEGIIDVKSIVRGNLSIELNHIHYFNDKFNACDAFGNIKEQLEEKKNIYYKKYYIDHYFTKSTEELILKIKRGAASIIGLRTNYLIHSYFEINKITLEKINYIESQIHVNLSEYRNKTKYQI
jgi:hypothetical protein